MLLILLGLFGGILHLFERVQMRSIKTPISGRGAVPI